MKIRLSQSHAIYYAMIITVHFMFCVLAGALGWHRQVVIVPVCSVLAAWSAWRLIVSPDSKYDKIFGWDR